ncbi:hypothetical protein WH279_07275 [Erwinia sp. MYb375]|uniref:hypothetical protein n=1 Tax=unclassified Erwinia TaxID=2622719 RepID=UPI0030B00A52
MKSDNIIALLTKKRKNINTLVGQLGWLLDQRRQGLSGIAQRLTIPPSLAG